MLWVRPGLWLPLRRTIVSELPSCRRAAQLTGRGYHPPPLPISDWSLTAEL